MMRRTDLVVPAPLVPDVRMPSLAVTTGEADPEWVDVPMSTWRFRRRPSQRLPLDAASARRARRYVRLAPWSALVSLVLLGWAALSFADLAVPGPPMVFITVCVALAVVQSAGVGGELPRQVPYRTPPGDLRIPEVPVEVAQQWIEQNPGVIATDEPAPRPHSRRFYAAWSVPLVAAAVGLGVVLATNGREDPVLLRILAAVLFFTGVAMAWRMMPRGFIRVEHPESS